ncbi:TSC22 domain family protein 1-like isoform X1 [Dreissena polymorpha]|nr:TSC22 domain family protein 1-like isoform X1 [Dreissena polymorpha]
MSEMADRPTNVNIAVTSAFQELKSTLNRDDLDQRAGSNSPMAVTEGAPRKKGAFKITSVKRPQEMTIDIDSNDDLDETHTEVTENDSSVLESSHDTDYGGQETPSAVDDIPSTNQAREGKDNQSRFRVVKIVTNEHFKRGRWTCHDYMDPQQSTNVNYGASEPKFNDEGNSGSSSAGSSIHYVHGLDDPSKNPLLAGATGTIHYQMHEGVIAGQDSFQPIHPAPVTAVHQSGMVNNQQSQIPTKTFNNDVSAGFPASSISQSHSNQSISYVASMNENMHHVSSGHPVQISSQVINQTPIDASCSGMYMPHMSATGSSISMQSVYNPAQSLSQMQSEQGQTHINQIQNVGQGSSTIQAYSHQIQNPKVSISGHNETLPSEINASQHSARENLNALKDPIFGLSTDKKSSGADFCALDKNLNVLQNADTLSPALAATIADLTPTAEDKGQGGSSTVAIDNKIEQAMDLVKSHLMFAVREEVEVLKEQIAELIERNNQLEHENGILRAAASPETLAKLAQPPPSSSS